MIQRYPISNGRKRVASLVGICLPPPKPFGSMVPQAAGKGKAPCFSPNLLDRSEFSWFGSMSSTDNSSGPLSTLSAIWKSCFPTSSKAQFHPSESRKTSQFLYENPIDLTDSVSSEYSACNFTSLLMSI